MSTYKRLTSDIFIKTCTRTPENSATAWRINFIIWTTPTASYFDHL